MYLSVCGFNHKSANLHDREIFQFQRTELPEITASYKQFCDVQETVVIATCNRVEFYRVIENKNNHYEELIRFYKNRGIKNASLLRDICYCFQGTTAARHLFRVTSGLDSLVLGEDQVIRQVKDAYSSSCAVNGPGAILHKLFHLAFQIAKRIRNETMIASGPQNIPGAALELLSKRMDGAPIGKAMICGVNNLSEILLEHLTRRKIPTILANRTFYHAQKMAGGYGAIPVDLDEAFNLLNEVDVVFTVTASRDYIFKYKSLKKLNLKNKNLYFVDIAVPRNVDPGTGKIPGIKILDLQDLKRYLDVSQERRMEGIPEAEELIEEQVSTYSIWRTKISQLDKIEELRGVLNSVRLTELEKIQDSFRKGDYRALEAFSGTIMKEFLRLIPYLLDDQDNPIIKNGKNLKD